MSDRHSVYVKFVRGAIGDGGRDVAVVVTGRSKARRRGGGVEDRSLRGRRIVEHDRADVQRRVEGPEAEPDALGGVGANRGQRRADRNRR